MATTDPIASNQIDPNLSITAPMAGGSGMLPTQQLQPRKLNTTPTFTSAVKINEKTDYTKEGYVGQGLVDKNGNIARTQYGSEAYAELAKFKSVSERKNFLERLYQVGLYGGSKPSPTGFDSRDISAMQDALNWSNWRGYTIDVAATMMAKELGTVANGGNRIRTTAKEDLRAVFKQAAGTVLGRQLSDKEIEKFVKSYNQKEMVEGGGGASAPTASVAAEQAVMSAAPEEAKAMGALNLTNIFDSVIKGLG
jgi:hypothetical protein